MNPRPKPQPIRNELVALALALAVGPAAIAESPLAPPQGAVHELKDSHGRLVRRVIFRADGELQTSSFLYQAEGLLSSEEEHLDAARKPLRRVKETFDKEGRLAEREDLSAVEGKLVGSRTRYRYDARGRRTEERTVIE